MSLTDDTTRAAIEQIARESYGKCIAIISSKTRDISFAQDCLAHAFEQALKRWPNDGVPEYPEAWLIKTAKNWNIDQARRAESKYTQQATALELDNMPSQDNSAQSIPDKRLQLLFVCSHPAIDAAIRTPLMLQTVLGIEAKDIAPIFVLAESTLAQRLVRAKRKIKAANIPFSLPEASQMPGRLEAVLEAVYGAYAIARVDETNEDLVHESLFLSNLLLELMPNEPEVIGLHALLCFSIARMNASVVDNKYVPLEEQDRDLWDSTLLIRGRTFLLRAAKKGSIGRFQLEATIHGLHCEPDDETKWPSIVQVHDALMILRPSLGVAVSRAAAIAKAVDADAGLAALAQIDSEDVTEFQSFWATRAHLLVESGNASKKDVSKAYEKAIALSDNDVVREWLCHRLARHT